MTSQYGINNRLTIFVGTPISDTSFSSVRTVNSNCSNKKLFEEAVRENLFLHNLSFLQIKPAKQWRQSRLFLVSNLAALGMSLLVRLHYMKRAGQTIVCLCWWMQFRLLCHFGQVGKLHRIGLDTLGWSPGRLAWSEFSIQNAPHRLANIRAHEID